MASAPIDDTGTNDAGNDDRRVMSEVEEIAAGRGWKPKDQYDGPESNWRPAGDFLRKIRTDNDLRKEIGELKNSIAGIARAADKQVKREVAERTREIEERFQTAVEAKDAKGAADAAKDMRALEREQSAPIENAETRFAAENPWYGKDEDATAYAISVSNREANKGTSVEGQLKAAAEAVKKRFPELYAEGEGDKAGAKTLTLNSPGRNVGKPAGKTFADMPGAAKAAADRFYEQAKMRNGDKVPDRKTWDAAYAKDFFGE